MSQFHNQCDAKKQSVKVYHQNSTFIFRVIYSSRKTMKKNDAVEYTATQYTLCGEEQNYALNEFVSRQFNNYTNRVGLFSCCDIAR